jgi:hypothetical protein
MRNNAALIATILLLAGAVVVSAAEAPGGAPHEIAVAGTRFQVNGRPFPYTGLSFFNAIYNPAFNKSSEDRVRWFRVFKQHGINVLRIWCQWDNARGFVDAGPASTMYNADGRLRPEPLARLKEILIDADGEGMVVELVLFCQESWRENIRLGDAAMDRAVEALASELRPHRNLTFQVWNEMDHRVPQAYAIIKRVDAKRLVSNSPGFAGVLGGDEENRMLDYLTPHTSRQDKGRTWEIAPREIAGLIAKFNKPVVDDEPARCGTSKFGGPKDRTWPTDHILQIQAVWQAGGYTTYHHDMFQTGYGSDAVPPSGIPEPQFSPYHKQVFEFLANRERYQRAGEAAR